MSVGTKITGNVDLTLDSINLVELRRAVEGIEKATGNKPLVWVWGEFFYFNKRGKKVAVNETEPDGEGILIKNVGTTVLELYPNATDPKKFLVYPDGPILRAHLDLVLI